MKKTALFASSLIVAFSLTGCTTSKNQSVDAAPTQANVISLSTTAETKDPQQPATEASKQQASIPEPPKIEYAFTQDKGHPEKILIGIINEAKSNLDIAIYSLTNKDIVDAILAAKKRGVAVRVLTDKQEAGTAAQSAKLKELKAAGIPIKDNTHKGIMHMKVTIADKSIVTTGSYNYSVSATTTNDEVIVAIHDAKLAQEWDTEFEKMWSDKVNFQDFK
ncbi:phospholipase D family nuclease [Paenibacillus cremeus]|uniref:phospholipase D n=1 Tax=Paenibacillus cremeus TaxID=2163881 RepID=A0A559K7Y9_9BACL|nr:phospholipase D family protein [Paenibacillus cremeus]TVY08224.1 phospholipase D family protein [Paenibacillus cremeus]